MAVTVFPAISGGFASPTWSTFTPTVTLVGGSSNTVPQFSTNTGRYIVVGKIIHLDIYLVGDGGNEGAGTGVLNIALPATAGANNPTSYFPCGYFKNTAEVLFMGQIASSGTTISLAYLNGTTLTNLTGADWNGTGRTGRLKFSYEID